MAYLARRLFASRQSAGSATPQASPEGLQTALANEVSSLRGSGNVHPALLSILDRDHDGDVDLQDFTGAGNGNPLPAQTAEMRSPRPLL
jgi:hypothetical protein